VDLGYLECKKLDGHGQTQPPSAANPWGLQLGLHELRLVDARDWLPNGRWIIRLIATADDAATQTYDVAIEWGAAEMTPQDALKSVALSITNV
jgi:hypothetical protein